MADTGEDELFMRAALAEARRGVGMVSPNPAVGAVLVHRGHEIGVGYHRARGLPHAEVECLTNVPPEVLRAATLYVTLEPCSTTGRTPPCTDAIIRAGIRRVVIGAIDPNPKHGGRGVSKLRAAGVNVTTGLLAEECTRLNKAFNKWIVTGRPYVIAKCGMSLDGRLTKSPQEGRWLTSPAARRHALGLRAAVDAILIGAETLRQDNPHLTNREGTSGRQPWRVVLTRSGKLPRRARLFRDRFADRTLVYRRWSLGRVLQDLGRREVISVLIEGGGNVLGQAFDARLVDKVQFYLAPIFTGGPVFAVAGLGGATTVEGAKLRGTQYERIGADLVMSGYPIWSENGSE